MMVLLEAAKALIEPEADFAGETVYLYCGGRTKTGHNLPCELALIPQIVAVLEAAERYVSLNRRDDVPMTDLMEAEDDLHAVFGDERRYDIEAPS